MGPAVVVGLEAGRDGAAERGGAGLGSVFAIVLGWQATVQKVEAASKL